MNNTCKDCGSPDLMLRSNGSPRTLCRKCYNAQKRANYWRRKLGEPVESEKQLMLDNGPLRRWLKPLVADEKLDTFAQRIGVDGTGFRRLVLGETQKCRIDFADRIFCRLGHPGGLREEYPELYEFTPEQEAEAEAWANGV